jgi:hypothetical protein
MKALKWVDIIGLIVVCGVVIVGLIWLLSEIVEMSGGVVVP